MQNLVAYIVRKKIYDSLYWKQDCFGLTAERIVDKAVDLRYCGGMYGEPQKPTEFIALVLKMLQIQPEKDIILEFIKDDDFKVLRLLGAFYMRLTGRPQEVYRYLEPLLNDYRRVRIRDESGQFRLSHIDEVIDDMLRKDYLFSIALPKLPARHVLEETGQLDCRASVLADEFDQLVAKEQEDKAREEVERLEKIARREREEARQREKWHLSGRDRKGRDRRRSKSPRRRSRERQRYRRSRSRSRSRSYDRYERESKRRRSRDYDKDHRGPGRHSQELEGRNADNDLNGAAGSKESLSVQETNKLRESLGLPPLK